MSIKVVACCAALAASGVLLVACGGGDDDEGGASTAPTSTVALERVEGRRAVVETDAFVERPATLSIRVSVAPKQRVSVAYGLTCTDRPTRSASYDVTPPATRSVRLPAGATDCALAARAELLRGRGRLKLTLLATER